MKVTFVLPTVNLSGGARVASIYAQRLSAMGHDVVVVSPPPRPRPMRERLRHPLKFRTKTPKSHFDGEEVNHHVIERWRPIVDRDVPDADVVVATWWETAEWVARLSSSKGAKVHFVQGHEVFDWLPIERCKASYRLPLHKIVVARWLKAVMEAEYDNADVDVVPNSVDHHQFFAPPRGKRRRPTVGFLYSTAALKGIDVSLRAIADVRTRFPDLDVISFGDRAPSEGTLDGVQLHVSPHQSALRDIYASCDVWLTASRSEGFNLPAMEAMACRTPVVSTRTGWPEESIIDGVNGFCVAIDDSAALAKAVGRVLSLPDDEWRRMSTHAFQTVESSSWDNSAKQFEAALVKAAARSLVGAEPTS
jgi:glycosyltransferase involved in cell wall biosynthesis